MSRVEADVLVTFIAQTFYNMSPIVGSIKQLCGYSDRNYLLTDSAGNCSYVLKIVGEQDSDQRLTDIIDEILDNANEFASRTSSRDLLFTTAKPVRTSANRLSTFTKVPSAENNLVESNLKLSHYFDGVTIFDLINNRTQKFESERWTKLGIVCNQLFLFLRTQCHLRERLKSIRQSSSFVWQLMTCDNHLRQSLDKLFVANVVDSKQRTLVEKVLVEFDGAKKAGLHELPEHIQHGDLCNRNILTNLAANRTNKEREKFCIVDFQDVQVGPQVLDLSMMMLYGVLEQGLVPFELALRHIPNWLYKGYQSAASGSSSLEEQELSFAPTLIKLRLCQSLLNGLLSSIEGQSGDETQSAYVLHTNQRGWQLLELMLESFENETLVGWWRDTC